MPRFGDIKGLPGLTANDRSASDKIAISQQAEEPNYMVSSPSQSNLSISRQLFKGLHDTNAIMQNTYQEMLQTYKDKYAVDNPNIIASTSKIQDVAYKVSPYYKKFFGTDYLSLDSNDWAKLAAQYEATREVYGEEEANTFLNSAIKDNVAENQPWYEQLWYGFKGMGASAAGSAIATVGAIKGAIDYFDGDYEDRDYMSGWENFMNSVIDNEWTRYGNDVVQYGALLPENLKRAKELGLSDLGIVETAEQEESLLSSATPWLALQSGGFTLASMAFGWGEAKLASLLFTGATKAAKAAQAGKALTKTIEGIRKTENFTNKFIIPGMVGTSEGLIEGLSTKQQVEEDGLREVRAKQSEEVAKEVNNRLSKLTKVVDEGIKYYDEKGNLVDVDALYQQVWNEFSPKYEEALKQVDYAASRAGINNFYANSLINGLMNSTLKAGLQAAPVRKQLQNSRLYGWMNPETKFTITGSGTNAEVTSSLSKGSKAWIIGKEVAGEFSEEYLQSVSDATMRGGAENNIHNFIENKYLGDGPAVVGETYASDYSAAWGALTGSLTDKEAVKSGIMGAISSVMGTPFKMSRARTGELDENGKAKTTLFGRGLNEKGEKESAWEMVKRLTPWRSGVTGGIREIREKEEQGNKMAEHLKLWLRDPDNKDKFDGLVGTFNWAKAMGEAARGNDEFGYRNSALGKTINDAFMLQKLKGTKYYDAFMDQLIEIANLEEGTASADSYIKSMRDNVNTMDESISDAEVLKTLKKNANLMLSTIDKIQSESESIDKLLGNVDNDTKQTLIYSQMMLEDWKERRKKLKEELGNITISNSRESSNLTKDQKSLVAEYGSLERAKEEIDRLIKLSGDLDRDIENLKSKKHLTKKEKDILKEKKAKYKSTNKALNKLEEAYDPSLKMTFKDVVKDVVTVGVTDENIDDSDKVQSILSEEDIMALDPISRATVLKRGKAKTYIATHSKEEFYAEKKRLTEELESLNSQMESHLDKDGNVKKYHNKKAKVLKDKIDETSKKLDNLQTDEKQYYSDEQQAVIDNIINEGTSQDRDFLSKIVDIGRIENSIKTFYDQYNAILSDRDSFKDYVFYAKAAAADIAIKRRYDSLNKMTDYGTFAKEMDRVYKEGTEREKIVLTRELSKNNNEFYKRYINERELIRGIVTHVAESENFENLSDNDIDMFVHTLTYLSDKGVDFINDEDAVLRALSGEDANGTSLFKKYVEEVNSSVEEPNRTVFTSIGEAIQNFKNVIDSYKKQQKEIAANNTPIEIEPTTPEQAAPVKHDPPVQADDSDATKNNPPTEPTGTPPSNPTNPSSSPGGETIFDHAATSADESFLGPNGAPITSKDIDIKDQPQTDPILTNFKENSSEEVAVAAEIVLKAIKNMPRASEEAKSKARKVIEELSVNSYDTVEEFTDDINSRANTIEAQSEDGESEEAFLLRQAASRALANKLDSEKSGEKKKTRHTFLLDKVRSEIDKTTQNINTVYNMYPHASENSGFIASINIDKIRQDYPNSVTVKYYETYDIDEAIRDGVLEGNPDILFITDEELTRGVREELESQKIPYTAETSLPIVAVVKSEFGAITIDGVNYQPIGVMPSTSKKGSAGSTNMGPIRNLALSNKGTQLVNGKDGKPIVTKLYGMPKAYPVDIKYRGGNKVISIGIEDLSQEEAAKIKNTNRAKRRYTPEYNKAKSRFLKRLKTQKREVEGIEDGDKKLVFEQTRLDGNFNYIEIFKTPIAESTASDSDSTFLEVLSSGNPADIIAFNSRTRRAAASFNRFIDSLRITNEMIFGTNLDSNTTKILSDLGETLDRDISNFINIPTRYGWTYSVIPTQFSNGENRVMSINLFNTETNETIHLVDVHAGMTKEEREAAQAEFLKNIITDNGTIRMIGKNNPFAKWNVPYSDVEKMGENKDAKDNIENIYDDDILYVSATSFNYRIQGFAVQNLFSNKPPVTPQVGNPNNAQPQGPINQHPIIAGGQVNSGGAIIDSHTGAVLDGTTPTPPTNPYQENAKRKVAQINEDSGYIKLLDDGTGYIDTRTGTLYSRVTSIILADALSPVNDDGTPKRFDSNNPWGLVSTSIGNGFDTFVRDFFSGKISDDFKVNDKALSEVYPNATEDQLRSFAKQLAVLRNKFIAEGLTIVPRDVTVTGVIDVVDSNENLHKINVAGTLDLLAYDSMGNFHIFDMKTHRSEEINEEKLDKYAKQLSLYKELLEKKYGIKVASAKIIPIHVGEYEEPAGAKIGRKKGIAVYKKSDNPQDPKDQLIKNGKRFNVPKAVLQDTIDLTSKTEPLHIVWEKLTDLERETFSRLEEEIIVQTGIQDIDPVEAGVADDSSADTTDILLGTEFSEDYLGDMFGIEDDDFNAFTSSPIDDTHRPIPTRLQWGVWEGFTNDDGLPINVEATIKNLEKLNYTKEMWDSLDDNTLEHILKCSGAF